MTNEEKNIYWRNWSRFQRQYEKKYIPRFKKILNNQIKAFASSKDVLAIPIFPLYNEILALYYEVGPAWAKKVKKMSTKADGFGFNEEIIQLMKDFFQMELLNLVELMNAYSRQIITDVLNRGIENGASFDEIVRELTMHPEFSTMRATRIARTEVVSASNTAAMLYSKSSGIEMNKVWIAVRDKRTRHDHSNVDGTTIDSNAYFNVGAAEMLNPGARVQKNGLPTPLEEIVNCRCTLAFIGKRDAQGKLITSS
jgi:hypothetical protein